MLHRLSLTVRLTVFFTLVAGAVVLGLGLLFMAAADSHFAELDRAALADKKRLIESILDHAQSPQEARARLGDALSYHHGLHVLVKDAQGATLFETGGLTAPPANRAMHSAAPAGHVPEVRQASAFHALRFQAPLARNPGTVLDVSLAVDTSHHQEFLSDLRRQLALYAAIATLVSGLLGWLAAHQGMAPLRAMKARAAAVTGQQLQERMPVEAFPVEMADLAQALNQMLGRLEDDFQRLSEFSSNLAHELRTPISNLLTQTQVSLSAKRDAATYRDILASNAEELQRLARMVSDMLFLAKTERGIDLPNKEQFFAAPEVQALLDFYEAVAEDKGIHLSAHGDGAIQGDRLMFRRAVSNLLSNALRHTPEGGEVQIEVSTDAQGTQVRVENTGEAIDPKDLPRLFERFYRADAARTHPPSDGSGLGLSITKAIVEAHQGQVLARSAGGRTQFCLTFPHAPHA